MVLVENHERILTPTLNRPEVHSALDTEAWRKLRAAVAGASDPARRPRRRARRHPG
jgi:enoyl-CoA hydratase/carnithine racemase